MKKIAVIMLMAMAFACDKSEPIESDSKKANCVEKIDPDKACAQIYDPVCGCNLKTYGNACMASISGIEVIYNGECKK